MIKHIVMWDVRGETERERSETAQLVKNKFESLIGQIPGLIELEVGIDESRISYACDVVLYTVFRSVEDLNAYAEHPRHLDIRRDLEGARVARHQVDYHA